MSSLSNDGDLIRDFRGVARGQDEPGLRVDEVAAQGAAKKCLGQDGSVSEARLGVDLLLQLGPAVRTLKLVVEGLLFPRLPRELILVSFDESPRNLGIHFFERAHGVTVAG